MKNLVRVPSTPQSGLMVDQPCSGDEQAHALDSSNTPPLFALTAVVPPYVVHCGEGNSMAIMPQYVRARVPSTHPSGPEDSGNTLVPTAPKGPPMDCCSPDDGKGRLLPTTRARFCWLSRTRRPHGCLRKKGRQRPLTIIFVGGGHRGRTGVSRRSEANRRNASFCVLFLS